MIATQHTAFGVVVGNARPLCDLGLPFVCLGVPRAGAYDTVVEVVGGLVEENRLAA